MNDQTTDWPYDADRDHPLAALRIPVTSSHPDYWYLIAFDRESTAQPTDAEAKMLASYLDFVREWFNESWKKRMLAKPLDTDPGQNTVIFHKWADGDWGYRRATHVYGPLFWPGYPGGDRRLGPYSLPALLDHLQQYGDDEPRPAWVKWKAEHADVFPAADGEARS